MKHVAIFLFLVGLTGTVYAATDVTPFDLQVSSEYFFEPNQNKHHLVMKPGEAQQITIDITNSDSKTHIINLQMAKEIPRSARSFVFEPSQLEINPGDTATSILTASASPDADPGTTIQHALIAKSTTFGAKSFGFFLDVSDQPNALSPDPVRMGSPGGIFSPATQFDLEEEDAMAMIPHDITTPIVPDGYYFQGIYDAEQLIYSKQPVSSDTRELEFWDNGGLLIRFLEEKHLTYDDYLESLNPNEQQVRINGKNGIASESLLLSSLSGNPKIHSNSQVTVFLDDVLLRAESQIPLQQLLKVTESMIIKQNPVPEPTPTCEIGSILRDNKCVTAEPLCGPDTTPQDGICMANKTDERQSHSGKWGQYMGNQNITPPLKQMQSGIKFHNVECKEGLQLVYKKTGDTSACVTLFTEIELVVRGWATDSRVMLGCTGERVQKCYPEDPTQYRNDLYEYYFGDEKGLPSSDSFDFTSLHTENACTDKPRICYGMSENGTKTRISCDYPLHGCGIKSFDSYKIEEDIQQWKKYITVSASNADHSEIPNSLYVYEMDDLSDNIMMEMLLAGADGCKNETEVCSVSRGISSDRMYSFGISVTDSDQYTITINEEQAQELMSQIPWTVQDNSVYSVVSYNNEHYLLVLSTFDHTRTPDVAMGLIGVSSDPATLKRDSTLEYTVQLDTWATYGTDAEIILDSIHSARDSGIKTWVEPSMIVVPERSSANATLFVLAPETARDGIYDIRIGGKANGNNAGLHCGHTDCPTVQIGDSDWSIRTFGSNTGMGIGSGNPPENTSLEIKLNKKEFLEGETVEIKAYLANNVTHPIVLNEPMNLLIKAIRADSKGYYSHFYGIDARNESGNSITIEPGSKMLLVRPFYWDPMTFENFDDEHRVESSSRKMTATFVAGEHTWKDDTWFEIK
ncbi:MAG: hypothetical protein GKS07_07660 [Nitrosopumilus sp.]|nr:MAG: hypothetical protein GKS07_07660 [Nitrosopumilus sp.]